MKKIISSVILSCCLVSTNSYAISATDFANVSLVLNQVSVIVDKYPEVQALLDQRVIELNVPDTADGNSGKYLFPYTEYGELTPWADKALHAAVGAEVGAMAAEEGTKMLASQVPFAGLFASSITNKSKETAAILAVGGWDYIRETSEVSFDSLKDLSVYMHAEFYGDPDYETALQAATAIYPKLERGHKKAIDKAYKDAQKRAKKLEKDPEALAAAEANAAEVRAAEAAAKDAKALVENASTDESVNITPNDEDTEVPTESAIEEPITATANTKS
jgi:hypothetical protein